LNYLAKNQKSAIKNLQSLSAKVLTKILFL